MKKISNIKDYILVFFLIFLPRLIITLKAYPLTYISDETSAISIAALVAGYDWSKVISHAGYYGIGYLWIFAPLFHLFDDPIIIYRLMLVVLAVTVSISGLVCYYVMDIFFEVQSRLEKTLISSICGLLNVFVTLNINIRNEEIYYLIIWITVAILCSTIKNTENGKTNFRNQVLLILFLLFSLTVHTRAICLIIGVLAMDILLRFMKKKSILHKYCYLCIGMGYIVIKYMLKVYQKSIWMGYVRNSSVSSSLNNSLSEIQFGDMETYLDMLRIALGQIFTACVMSGGIFIGAIVAMILFFFYYMKKTIDYDKKEYIFVIGGIFLFCTLFTIAGQSVTWLPGVYAGTVQNDPSVYVTHYRAFRYMRYMGVYVAPFVMCSCILLYNNKTYLKCVVRISMLLFLGLMMFWIEYIHPYYQNRKELTYLFLGNMRADVNASAENYFYAYLLALSLLVLVLITSKYKWGVEIWLLISLYLLIGNQIHIFSENTYYSEVKAYEKADAGYRVINELIHRFDVDEIYVYDATDAKDHNLFYMYQYLNFNEIIIPELPKTNTNNDVLLFSNKKIHNELDSSYKWAKLDENEYIYAKGDSIIGALNECTLELQMIE